MFRVSLIYVLLLVLFFSLLQVWSAAQLTTTIFWFFSTALSTFFSINKLERDSFFVEFAKEQLKIIVLFEFVVNYSVFSFATEFFLFPVMAFLGMLLVVAQRDEKTHKVARIVEFLLFFTGVVLFMRSAWLFIGSDAPPLLQVTKEFVILPILSLCLIPFAYFLKVYCAYELFFINVKLSGIDKNMQNTIMRESLIRIHFKVKTLNEWRKTFNRYEFNSKNDIRTAINNIQLNCRKN